MLLFPEPNVGFVVSTEICVEMQIIMKHQQDGTIRNTVDIQSSKASLQIGMDKEGLVKEVGLELSFGRWSYLSEWRKGITRKATYILY